MTSLPKAVSLVEVMSRQDVTIAPETSTAIVPVRTLDDITADIRRSHSEAMKGLSVAAAAAIRTGEYLLEAKKLVKHGEWQDRVVFDCGLKLSTAQMYMKLAAHKDQLSQLVAANPQTSVGLSQAQALKFLSSAQQKRKRTRPATKAQLPKDSWWRRLHKR